MIRILIHVKGLERPISATISSGDALLVGREPDPARLNWSQLQSPQSQHAHDASPRLDPKNYQLTSLVLPSPRASANHLLLLSDGPSLRLLDLGSRNGSWLNLDPYKPVTLNGALTVSLSLSGPLAPELRHSRPVHAEWKTKEEFGPAVVSAVKAWLAQNDMPVQCLLVPTANEPDALPLGDGQALILRLQGTMPVALSAMHEVVCQYVHDQNTRFLQLERRVQGLVASSAALRQILFRLAEAAAGSRRTILLGPTGVGKELLARSYHGYSPRHSGPFVTVNCALLEKDLLHAQLFGARRGSFTGAVADVVGLVESASGGTLFLDELGEMSTDVQKALLRFLDSRGEYYRLGDTRPRQADVQVVCASNVNLDDPAYRQERFRNDLWYRLASTVIRIPPLVERADDIRAFLRSRSVPGSSLRVAECLTEEALAAVLRDPWPGNFRDLENFIDRLPTTVQPRSIDLATCKRALKEGRASSESPIPQPGPRLNVVEAAQPATAAAARHEGRAAASAPSSAPAIDPVSQPRATACGQASVDSNAALGWEQIMQNAARAFLEDHGEARFGWDQLQILIERYLKPLFVAQAAISRKPAQAGRSTNYSALARQLHIGDGSTVKNHLARFEERFAELYGLADRSVAKSSGTAPSY